MQLIQYNEYRVSTVDTKIIITASEVNGISTVCSTIHSGIHQRKHQSPVSLTLCEGDAPVTGGFPSQMTSNIEKFPCYDHHEV